MRIDHYAYQQATRVAGFGLLLQVVIGLTLLAFGRLSGDTTFQYASYYVLTGVLVWISLVVIFQQHKLERLEALEADELAAMRGSGTSVFESEGEDLKVAARRLKAMHKWLMPVVSLLVAGLLVLFGAMILRDFRLAGDVTADIQPFSTTKVPGWAIALCLFMAAIAFIFSRFVAGMAKQPAWQNLRGGAGYMVGNALVMFALAVGIIFIFFGKAWVMELIAKGVAIFMFVVALEIGLNFVLNLYRPRRPGEVPRPAFDSRLLSLFAAPDSIVRTINEAVNYQFGFDITSSWGYQLLMRSFAWLAGFAAVVLIVLNMIVVVEPGEQAVRLRGGAIVDDTPREAGLYFKLPWPFETAHIEPVARVREMALGARSREFQPVNLWTDKLNTDIAVTPFIVASGSRKPTQATDDAPSDFALVLAELVMYWRIKPNGLLDFLSFADDVESRRQRLNMRDQVLRALALREASRYLSTQPLETVLAQSGESLGVVLRDRIQSVFDEMKTGVEVVAVSIPVLKPPQETVDAFEDRIVEIQGRRQQVVAAHTIAEANLVSEAGSVEQAQAIVQQIAELDELRRGGADPQQIAEKTLKIEELIMNGNARSATYISAAQADRWRRNMTALARSREVLGDLASYVAAPDLYRQRKIMEALARVMTRVRAKYIVGVDPSRVNIDFAVQEPDSGLNISENLSDEATGNTEGSSQ